MCITAGEALAIGDPGVSDSRGGRRRASGASLRSASTTGYGSIEVSLCRDRAESLAGSLSAPSFRVQQDRSASWDSRIRRDSAAQLREKLDARFVQLSAEASPVWPQRSAPQNISPGLRWSAGWPPTGIRPDCWQCAYSVASVGMANVTQSCSPPR